MSDDIMNDFCLLYNLHNLITEPTCYKNAINPSSIDVILTNRRSSFHDTMAIETGLSDHHKMTLTVLKSFKKIDPKIINYRSYKNFNENLFRDELRNILQYSNNINMNCDEFKEIFMGVLNKHAPIIIKCIRGNNAPLTNKKLSKPFMNRSKMKNKFNKNPSKRNEILYKRQRYFCFSLLKKERKNYYNNIDLKIFDDNKTFCQRIKPLFSDKLKIMLSDIIIVENDITTSDNKEVAEKLNIYF